VLFDWSRFGHSWTGPAGWCFALFLEIGIIVPKTLFVDSILDKEPIFQPCVSLTQAMVIFREFSVNPARLMYPKEV
jgi:hypothetical protein